MKILKTAGIILLSTGIVTTGTCIYNAARTEKYDMELMEELRNEYKNDSTKIANKAKRAYFEASQAIQDSIKKVNISDSIKTAAKIK